MFSPKPVQSMRVKNKYFHIAFCRALFLLGALMAFTPSEAQVQELYLKGIARADLGEYSEARAYLTDALALNSRDADCMLKLAEVCLASGDRDAALEYMERVEELSPGKAGYLLATLYASEGNAGEAVRYLEKHLRSPYKLPSHRILLDDAFLPIEDQPEWRKLWARDWYTKDEELLQEIRYLGNSGDQLQALEIIASELEGRPDWDALLAARGDVLREMGQFQAAVQAYTDALEINSGIPAYHYGRARAYTGQEKYAKAIPDLEKAYRLEPENLELLTELGRTCRKAGQPEKAAAHLERYLGYYPDDAEARYLSGQIHFDLHRYLDALEQFNACLRLDSGDPRFFKARGKTYLETGTYRYALNDFGMALDLDPRDADVWYLRGLVRQRMNDPDGAKGDWQKAARLGSVEAVVKLEEYDRRK